MRSIINRTVQATLALFAISGVAMAQSGISNDSKNYQGDRISFGYDLHKVKSKDTQKTICIPKSTSLRVVGQSSDTPASQIVTFISKPKACASPVTDEETGQQGEAYLIADSVMTNTPPNRFGMSFGMLAIPFKYQLTGNHNNSGSATLGGYIGRRFDQSSLEGFSIEPILFGGACMISVSSTSGGQTTAQDISGVSIGLGLVGTIKGSFQAGVVVGWDRVSKSIQYQYNNKPWLALEIGYSFLQ